MERRHNEPKTLDQQMDTWRQWGDYNSIANKLKEVGRKYNNYDYYAKIVTQHRESLKRAEERRYRLW